jgi:uncharacterized OsmC-like protein
MTEQAEHAVGDILADLPPSVTIRQIENYRFEVDFAEILPSLIVDENPPVGAGDGPEPVKLLLAAVAQCLSSSLLFALRKYHNDPHNITATAVGAIGRNAQNRLRVSAIEATIQLGEPASELLHLDRALATFEDFCTVTASVRAAIAVSVAVEDSEGVKLK